MGSQAHLTRLKTLLTDASRGRYGDPGCRQKLYWFHITRHPRYKYLADADKKNTFDIERYMKRRPAIVKPDEPFDLYELKATDLQPDNSTERKEM